MFTRRIPLSDRFSRKVNPTNQDDCWIWLGAPNSAGYGTIRECGRGGKTFLAHRVAYEAANGDIPDGLCVCHKCDVPMCVNPKHLFLGDVATNNADRDAKGRCHAGGKPGEGCGHAKLTNEMVLAIRRDIRTHKEIAEDFGIKRTTVTNIRARRSWKHI